MLRAGFPVLIGSVVNRDVETLQGKRVSEIAKEQGKDELDALFDLILADRGQTSAIYFMMSEDDMTSACPVFMNPSPAAPSTGNSRAGCSDSTAVRS